MDLPVDSDRSVALARELIAAKLNISAGCPAAPIASAILSADAMLSAHSGALPYSVAVNSSEGEQMNSLRQELSSYNAAELFSCVDAPTPTPGGMAASRAAERKEAAAGPQTAPGRLVAAPNPARDRSSFWFHLSRAESVRIRIFDLTGAEVLSSPWTAQGAGEGSISLSLSALAPGLYFAALDSGTELGRTMKAWTKFAVIR
jgi:hypothetical protein